MLSARLRWAFVAAAAIILSWQLFVPPIVGLADQGDFARVIGLFGFGPADRSTEYAFVAGKYVPDKTFRLRVYEQATSEYIFTGAAVLLNRLVSKDGSLDITIMGLVHVLAFLYAFDCLLLATAPIRAAPCSSGSWRCSCSPTSATRPTGIRSTPSRLRCIFFLTAAGREHHDLPHRRGLNRSGCALGTLGFSLGFRKASEHAGGPPVGAVRVPLVTWAKWPAARRALIAGAGLDRCRCRGQHFYRSYAQHLADGLRPGLPRDPARIAPSGAGRPCSRASLRTG